jgi:hypothetical protein
MALTGNLAGQVGQRAASIDDAGGGIRLAGRVGAFDVSAMAASGHWGLPTMTIDPQALAMLSGLDLAHLTQAQFDAALRANPVAGASVDYLRNQHAGADAVTTVGPCVLRADLAYDSQRVVYDQDLRGIPTAAVEGVAAVELQTGAAERDVIVELDYTHLLDDVGPAPLLFTAVDSVQLATRARWGGKHLGVELLAVAGLAPASYVLRPELTWKTGAVSLRAGGVIMGGETGSYGRYYRGNQGAYLGLRVGL